MAYSVEVYDDVRTIVVRYFAPYDMPEDLRKAARRVSTLMAVHGGGKFYRIATFEGNAEEIDVEQVMREEASGYPGTGSDPDVIPMLAGLPARSSMMMPDSRPVMFVSLEAALAYVRGMQLQ